ncbi:hypothetical protein EVAR_87883_1 [Eumeta japonica]|uniref:Uncharacterized protein n=1 Tax=Eumeta variegata TaxID=151549 RepID=A0A4C1WVA4_EUMVA|nr:hypothetical protein EVAR_87883_1 [Eumeta japonica]
MRWRTAMLNRDVLSAWSHTGPRTAIAIEDRVICLPAAIAGRITQQTIEDEQLHPNQTKPKHNKFAKQQPTDKSKGKDQFPPLKQGIRQSARAVIISNTSSAGGNNLRSAPPPAENQWKKPLP